MSGLDWERQNRRENARKRRPMSILALPEHEIDAIIELADKLVTGRGVLRCPSSITKGRAKFIWARSYEQAEAKGWNKTPLQRSTAGRHPLTRATTQSSDDARKGYSVAESGPKDARSQGRASPV